LARDFLRHAGFASPQYWPSTTQGITVKTAPRAAGRAGEGDDAADDNGQHDTAAHARP